MNNVYDLGLTERRWRIELFGGNETAGVKEKGMHSRI